MIPTRRGYAVALVVVIGMAMAWTFGARSLNAVVVPAVVVLVAGGVQLSRADPPALDRSQPTAGFPGETRTIEMRVESTVPCRVSDHTSEGLVARGSTVEATGDAAFEYEVRLDRRGERSLGPASIVTTDAFGLFRREFTYRVETPLLVYPDVYALAHTLGVERTAVSPDRQAFDRLREYVPGDPLRNIHWKSSAKRPGDDLLVAEFTAEEEGGVTVAAETTIAGRESTDAMASAAASVALSLLDAGATVGLVVADGSCTEAAGDRHRRELLELLARTRGGGLAPSTREDADVRVVVNEHGLRVIVDGRDRAFEDLVAEGREVAV